MKSWTITSRLLLAFAVLMGCMLLLAGLSMYDILAVVRTQNSHQEIFVPAGKLATDFEREALNARIFFIYHVTIQKPGSLDKGWEHYHNAESRQRELMTFVTQHDQLRELRPAVAQLGQDVDAYAPALQATLAIVKDGVTTGAAYDAQVKDWAAKGAIMVSDAGKVESLSASANTDSTRSMIDALKSECRMYGLIFCVGGTLVALLVWSTVQRIRKLLFGSVAELGEASVQIAAAANQASSQSQALAQASFEQAAMIEETSSASTEINSMALRATENSRSTADMMAHSEQTLEQTNQLLVEMVGAMDRIHGSSRKISKIIKVIDEVAFQTNILALNAAVEAARAGESGKGFAVVADEVRNLAQRCAQAAGDTASLIDDSIQSSDEGKTKVDQVAGSILAMTEEISKVKILVDEINLGSIEQSRGIEQISQAIVRMEQVTQSSAAGAEQGAAAAQHLHAQAESMKGVVQRLTHMVDRNPIALNKTSKALSGSTSVRRAPKQRRLNSSR